MLSFKINFAFSIKKIYICSIFMNISRKFIFFGNYVNVKENSKFTKFMYNWAEYEF